MSRWWAVVVMTWFTMAAAAAQEAPSPVDCGPGVADAVEMIVNDMTLPHEAAPSGVPESYDWQPGPRIGYGNEMPPDWSAFIAWGQVYEDAEGSPATNTRVQIRDLEAYVLGAETGRWELLQFGRLVEGAAYREDFADDVSVPADVRVEADGTISVRLEDGYNFHFWPAGGRLSIDPSQIGGITVTVQARLVVDDPALPDDRAQARYLMSAGADYWRALDAQWSNDWTANGDVGIGRFRFITTEWQAFHMTTAAADVVCANPPPMR